MTSLRAVAFASLTTACATEVASPTGGGGAGGEAAGAGGATTSGFGGSGQGGGACACADGVHTTSIVVASDEGALWAFDPATNEMAFIRDIPCAARPFSMAVDADGVSWILDVTSKDLVTVNLADGSACGDPGYDPGPLQSGLSLFGMTFVSRDPATACADLYAHSYSGMGPFTEGPDLGVLAKLERATMRFELLAAIDFDGGELSGTGAARLFAFAGVNPAKLVEYDRVTGAAVGLTPLTGLSKTNASAFAHYANSVYFFTEAPPMDCEPCLQASCGADYAACLQDSVCAEALACALEMGEVTDECGGNMGAAMLACVAGPCTDECLPSAMNRVSQVTRLDLGSPQSGLEVVLAEAPIRVVGAGTSVCAPTVPQ